MRATVASRRGRTAPGPATRSPPCPTRATPESHFKGLRLVNHGVVQVGYELTEYTQLSYIRDSVVGPNILLEPKCLPHFASNTVSITAVKW